MAEDGKTTLSVKSPLIPDVAANLRKLWKWTAEKLRTIGKVLAANLHKLWNWTAEKLRAIRKVLDSVSYVFNVLMNVFLVLVALWLFVYLVKFCIDRILPPKEITLVPFEVNVTNLKLEPGSPPKMLSAKLQRLRRQSAAIPSGYGFLQIPGLTTVPKEAKHRQSEVVARVQDLDLKVKDVDVNKIVQAIQTLLAPPKTELQGEITELASSVEVHCELVANGRTIIAWDSSRTKKQGVSNDELVDGLIDDIMFQMIYDVPRDARLKGWLSSAQPETDDLPNWQALQSFNHGLRALEEYQQGLSHDALKEAMESLQRMQIIAPDYGLGLYFYGVALSEDREEAKAADVFEKIQRLQASDAVKSEARFQRAAALLRLYNPENANLAVTELQELIKDLEKKQGAASASSDRAYFTKLLAISHAQLAYTFGTMIVLFGDASKYSSVTPEIDAARSDFNAVPQDQWASDREKNDVSFRIDNAAGYSLFRYAQRGDAAEFVKRCDDAIKFLTKADQARPNHYEVLQNLGMIYDDEFFDPSGIHLDMAETLYERTQLFVPNDYYQYERLARIQWRRLKSAVVADQKLALAKKGKAYAAESMERRPQARESLWLAARFDAETWKHQADGKDRTALAMTIDGEIKAATEAGFRNTSLLLECAQFLLDAADVSGTPSSDQTQFREHAKAVLDGAEQELKKPIQHGADDPVFLTRLRKRFPQQ